MTKRQRGGLCGFLTLALLVLATVPLVSSCSLTPLTRTIGQAFSKGPGVASAPTNPAFRYLRVVNDGREALMVLGYLDPHPNGPIETWYSSAGEVIRMQNGRIISTAGLSLDWRAVRFESLPSWKTTLEGGAPMSFVRERDEMPGYRFGVRETLIVRPSSVPNRPNLLGISPASLSWYEESIRELPSYPLARYGVRFRGEEAQVVYAEQCLSLSLCIAWQLWPADRL